MGQQETPALQKEIRGGLSPLTEREHGPVGVLRRRHRLQCHWTPAISQPCVPKPPASGLARDADGLIRRHSRKRRRKPVEFGTAGQASADEVRTRLQERIPPKALP